MTQYKAYTSLEQSKKLAKILPLESADMRYGYIAPYDYSDRMYDGGYDEIPYPKDFLVKNPNFSANEYDAELPCWSLTALLSILPYPSLHKTLAGWRCDSYDKEGKTCMLGEDTDNTVDTCYELILKLHELKML